MYRIPLLCIFLLYTIQTCEAYKILVVFPMPSKSHSYLGEGVVRHLLDAGHEVTYMTPYPKAKKQHPSLREIDVSSMKNVIPEDLLSIEKLLKKEVDISGIFTVINMFIDINVAFLENENAIKFFSDEKEQFDVVVAEWMFSELYSGISAVFNCPYIWVSPTDPHWIVLKLIDQVPNPSYTADALTSGSVPFSFLQRVGGLFRLAVGVGYKTFFASSKERSNYERLLVPIIEKRGHKAPDFEVLRYNASLMLGNSHVSTGQPVQLPQSYKHVGGYHIDTKVQPLPADLKNLLDNAKNGLIYFSMGSNLRSKSLPAELKASLLKMFGGLKQTVLWKFEEDLPNRPPNVHIVQWAPQHSILAHPNCILFITHGGLLSTTETIHFGKPIIGIPVFGDQFSNVDRSVSKGFAKRVDLSYTMADGLKTAINEMISDPSYADKAKSLSLIYHDRPVPPGKELVHWVEHVVRTRGAPHLRSPALLLPWYQKCYLDLVALIIAMLYIVKVIVKKLIGSLVSKKEKKTKKQ